MMCWLTYLYKRDTTLNLRVPRNTFTRQTPALIQGIWVSKFGAGWCCGYASSLHQLCFSCLMQWFQDWCYSVHAGYEENPSSRNSNSTFKSFCQNSQEPDNLDFCLHPIQENWGSRDSHQLYTCITSFHTSGGRLRGKQQVEYFCPPCGPAD